MAFLIELLSQFYHIESDIRFNRYLLFWLYVGQSINYEKEYHYIYILEYKLKIITFVLEFCACWWCADHKILLNFVLNEIQWNYHKLKDYNSNYDNKLSFMLDSHTEEKWLHRKKHSFPQRMAFLTTEKKNEIFRWRIRVAETSKLIFLISIVAYYRPLNENQSNLSMFDMEYVQNWTGSF